MQLTYLKPKEYKEGTNYDRITNYATVSVDDNGLEFFETDTDILYRVCAGAWLAINTGGGGMVAHDMTGVYHTASGLATGNVIIATGATTFAWGQLLHSQLGGVTANQHHNQVHGIVSADHTVTGSAFDVVGLTAANTLGVLTPSSDPTTNELLLKTDNDAGKLTLNRLHVREGGADPLLFEQFAVIGGVESAEQGAMVSVYQSYDTSVPSGITAGTLLDLTSGLGVADYTGVTVAGVKILHDVKNNDIAEGISLYSQISYKIAGTMAKLVGVKSATLIWIGTATDHYGYYVETPEFLVGGGITNDYGIFVEDINVAGTLNHAIHTNAGLVSLGDNLEFRQAATISTTTGQLTIDGASGILLNSPTLVLNYDASWAATDIIGVNTGASVSGAEAAYGLTALGEATTSSALRAYGFHAKAVGSHTTGTVSDLIGFQSQARNENNGDVTNLVGGNFRLFNLGTGTVGDAYGMRVRAPDNSGGGTITNLYGLYIDNQSLGGTLNCAIYTNAGDISFGDDLQFRQAATISTTAGQLTLTGNTGTNVSNNFAVGTTAVSNYVARFNGSLSGGQTQAINAYMSVDQDSYVYGMLFSPTINMGSTNYTKQIFGIESRPSTAVGYSGNITLAQFGVLSNFYHYGTGNVASIYNFVAGNPYVPNGGTVGTVIGLYVAGLTAGATNNYAIYTNAGDIRLMASASDKIGFHGSAPVAKQTVTGSRGGNAALTSLMTALANLGLVVNSTS